MNTVETKGQAVQVRLDPTEMKKYCRYLIDFLEGRIGIVEDVQDSPTNGRRSLVRFHGTASHQGNTEDGDCSWWVHPINLVVVRDPQILLSEDVLSLQRMVVEVI